MSSEDRLAIQQLKFQYAYYVDSLQIDEWVEAFTGDALFDEREFGNGLLIGREKIRVYGQSIVKIVHHIVHLMSNHLIFDLTPTTARGVAFCLTGRQRAIVIRLSMGTNILKQANHGKSPKESFEAPFLLNPSR